MTYYSKTHQWVKLDDGQVWVGITRHAADALEDILHINLPALGKHVKQGGVLCDIEAVKAASDVHSPLAGTVAEVNPKLADHPELLNASPEADAWICRLTPDHANIDIHALMNAEDYLQYRETLKK